MGDCFRTGHHKSAMVGRDCLRNSQLKSTTHTIQDCFRNGHHKSTKRMSSSNSPSRLLVNWISAEMSYLKWVFCAPFWCWANTVEEVIRYAKKVSIMSFLDWIFLTATGGGYMHVYCTYNKHPHKPLLCIIHVVKVVFLIHARFYSRGHSHKGISPQKEGLEKGLRRWWAVMNISLQALVFFIENLLKFRAGTWVPYLVYTQ
jgi:hypothetical protein